MHGGDVHRLNADVRDKILDYSSNINPIELSNRHLHKALKNIGRYPDVEYAELKKAIGEFHNVSTDNIVVGNGAVEILSLYFRSQSFKRGVIICPTFSEYERVLNLNEVTTDFFHLKEEKNYDFDLKEFKKMTLHKDVDVAILCNPNNPTGRLIPLETIIELNDYLSQKRIKLFLDESFMEFVNDWKDKSALSLKDENIFILKSFTKYFSIPGVRLGYGITFDKRIKDSITLHQDPWSINSIAEHLGKSVICDDKFMDKSDNWIKKEKKFVYKELLKNKKIIPFKTETNFILIKLLTLSSKEFKKMMLDKGVLIRDASNFRGLGNEYIRIAIKKRDTNKRVLNLIMEVTDERNSSSWTWK